MLEHHRSRLRLGFHNAQQRRKTIFAPHCCDLYTAEALGLQRRDQFLREPQAFLILIPGLLNALDQGPGNMDVFQITLNIACHRQ